MAGALNFLQGIFRGYFNMCLAASLVILVVLVLRLLLKNIPKNLMCVLWLAVLFRLLCPVTVAGPLPWLWPSGQPESGTEAQPGQNATTDRTPMDDVAERLPAGAGDGLQGPDVSHVYGSDGNGSDVYGSDSYESDGNGSDSHGSDNYGGDGNVSNGYNSEGYDSDGYGNVGHDTDRDSAGTAAVRAWFAALTAWEWAIFTGGIAALAGSIFFFIRNTLRFYKTVKEIRMAEALRPCTSRKIWGRTMAVLECEGKISPMVFGLIRPRICLPYGFAGQVSAREYDLILKHEGAHIRRGDCLLKYLSWIALSVHWWNPLARISVKLLQKDMEMACDEYVVAHSGEDVRKEYATVLLRFSMAQSGMTFPVAFGESSTERRVGNILKYKRMPVICTLSILGIMGALVVCLVTNPHNRKADNTSGAGLLGDGNAGSENAENENAGNENAGNKNDGDNAGGFGDDRETEDRKDEAGDGAAIPEDDRLVFSSREEALTYYQERWQEKLTADAASADAERIVVRQDPSPIRDLSMEDTSYRTQLYYYVMDQDTGIPTVYITCITYEKQGEKIYVSGSEDEAFEHVTTAEQARRMGASFAFRYFAGLSEGERDKEDINYAGFIAQKAMLSSGTWQFGLERPETSIPLLLHLEGGVGEFQRSIYSKGFIIGYVTYTFADGSVICYGVDSQKAVGNDGDDSFMAVFIPDGIIPESKVEAARQTEVYLQSATAQDFRNASLADDLDGWCWDLPVKPALLDMIQGRDVALYGLSGNLFMILRDGEQIYPVYQEWWTPHKVLPRIYMGDYDGDGEEEYALMTHMLVGVGVDSDELFILEKASSEESPNELSIHEFDYIMLREQLRRVSCDWDSEQKTMHMRVDGELTGLSVSLKEGLTSMEEWLGSKLTFKELVFDYFMSFTEENGQLYLQARGGILLEEGGSVHYDDKSVTLTAPVIYSDGVFSLGEITLTLTE